MYQVWIIKYYVNVYVKHVSSIMQEGYVSRDHA